MKRGEDSEISYSKKNLYKIATNRDEKFSDSQSVLMVLRNLENRNIIIRNIIELNEILNYGKEILYSWISSHINVESNEKLIQQQN